MHAYMYVSKCTVILSCKAAEGILTLEIDSHVSSTDSPGSPLSPLAPLEPLWPLGPTIPNLPGMTGKSCMSFMTISNGMQPCTVYMLYFPFSMAQLALLVLVTPGLHLLLDKAYLEDLEVRSIQVHQCPLSVLSLLVPEDLLVHCFLSHPCFL